MTEQKEPWAVTETRRLHEQTPEDAIVEDLHWWITGVETLDQKTMTRIGQDGRPYKVTRYQFGREQGMIEGLAKALAYIRTGDGYVHGDVAPKIIREMTSQVLAELREQS